MALFGAGKLPVWPYLLVWHIDNTIHSQLHPRVPLVHWYCNTIVWPWYQWYCNTTNTLRTKMVRTMVLEYLVLEYSSTMVPFMVPLDHKWYTCTNGMYVYVRTYVWYVPWYLSYLKCYVVMSQLRTRVYVPFLVRTNWYGNTVAP